MLSLKHVTRSRSTLVSSILSLHYPPIPTSIYFTCSYSSSTSVAVVATPYQLPSFFNGILKNPREMSDSFRNWCKCEHNELIYRIYEILNAHGNQNDDEYASFHSADLALSQLGLRLHHKFVLEVLASGPDVLSCLKFFDWAGRQPGYNHNRATILAIFKILSRPKLMPVMCDFLQAFEKRRYTDNFQFYETLVVGYAVAGKPDIALKLFGRMRFEGQDLDSFGYHVLLNSLVEENGFDAFEIILEQLRLRGHESHITHSIVIKNLCRQNRLDEAEEYLNWLVSNGKGLYGYEVGHLVGALYRNQMFESTGKWVQELGSSSLFQQDNAIGVMITHLVWAGRLDEALEFFQQKKSLEGYVPSLSVYNILIDRLLRKDRLCEVYDLLMEMKENHISPNMVSMNNVLCFFCKAGLVDVALELYNSRSQFGLFPNFFAYKNLLLALFRIGYTNGAFSILKKMIKQGHLPDKRIFTAVACALCRERKVDEIEELLNLASEINFVPDASICDKLISALCWAGRLEAGYLMHGKFNNVTTSKSYIKLIFGFCKSNRGDIAAELLMEMREKGHKPSRILYRTVFYSLLQGESTKLTLLNLLEMLSHHEDRRITLNILIQTAAYAKKAELAREVLELLQRNDINPSLVSYTYMLESYFRSNRISDALIFFRHLKQQGKVKRKLYDCLILGLCKVERVDMALEILLEMMTAKLTPSIFCFEILVQSLCNMTRYTEAINLVNDYEKMGRHITPFIGNTFLLHSMRTPEVFDACVRLRGIREEIFSGSSMLSLIIGAFSGCLKVNLNSENFEELIEKCFPLDKFTYNLLLKRVGMSELDQACELFIRMCQKRYVPNQYSYKFMLCAFFKHGKKEEAKLWLAKMLQRGFIQSRECLHFKFLYQQG